MASQGALESLICLECRRRIEVVPKQSYLGFRTFSCPRCAADNVYPLSDGHRKFYQIAMPVVMLLTLIGLWFGKPLVPGIAFVVLGYALLRDRASERAVKGASRVRGRDES